MKINWKLMAVLLTLMLFSVIGGIGTFIYLNDNKKIEKTKKVVEKNKIEEAKIEEYNASLIMVGDALIHSSVYRDAARLANYNGYNFKPQISYIKNIVKDYDINYYNQETILGGTHLGLSDYPMFNSPQEVGDAMIDAGFNLVSLATNHTVDSGKNAVLESRKYWNKQNNVHAVGSYSSIEEKKQIESKILEVNNIKYAMLNYTYGTNGLPVINDYLVNVWPTDLDLNIVSQDTKYQAYKETVKKDIQNIRDKVDVLIVAMHWGIEYTHEPTAYEKDMAKFLAENNVDIVIGTHPHVIQPVEWINNTIVFYSLGNFISAQYQNQGSCINYKCMVGLMSSLNITKTIDNGKKTITIDNIQNDLIYTYYSGWSNFKVIPFSNADIKNYLYNYRNVYDTYAKIIKSNDERIKTVPLGA